MKTKKIVIGTMAAAMLSLSVCSLIPASAAGETVQISAGKDEVKAGEAFKVEVSIADIPTAGMQACNFSLEYDSKLITIDEVKAGALVESAGSQDPSAASLPNFNESKEDGYVNIMWSTSVDDATYWLKGSGVLCTISGTVSASAKAGDVAAIKIVPTKRETHAGSGTQNEKIDCGYLKDGEKVSYEVKVTNGSVTVKGEDTTTQPSTGGGDLKVTLRGDANCDGKVTIADATAVLQSVVNAKKYALSAQGELNADVDDAKGVTPNDALLITQYDAGAIDKL